MQSNTGIYITRLNCLKHFPLIKLELKFYIRGQIEMTIPGADTADYWENVISSNTLWRTTKLDFQQWYRFLVYYSTRELTFTGWLSDHPHNHHQYAGNGPTSGETTNNRNKVVNISLAEICIPASNPSSSLLLVSPSRISIRAPCTKSPSSG